MWIKESTCGAALPEGYLADPFLALFHLCQSKSIIEWDEIRERLIERLERAASGANYFWFSLIISIKFKKHQTLWWWNIRRKFISKIKILNTNNNFYSFLISPRLTRKEKKKKKKKGPLLGKKKTNYLVCCWIILM